MIDSWIKCLLLIMGLESGIDQPFTFWLIRFHQELSSVHLQSAKLMCIIKISSESILKDSGFITLKLCSLTSIDLAVPR